MATTARMQLLLSYAGGAIVRASEQLVVTSHHLMSFFKICFSIGSMDPALQVTPATFVQLLSFMVSS